MPGHGTDRLEHFRVFDPVFGKMTLNRNPENFFAETEQVAFHTGHLVPGIDVTDDPLLQQWPP